MNKLATLLIPVLMLMAGCYYDKEADLYQTGGCATTDIRYSNIVKPIIDANCNISGCHNNITVAGGYNLSTFEGLKAIATSGQLIGCITYASGYSPMPQGREKLSDCQISQIRTWVDGGALNN